LPFLFFSPFLFSLLCFPFNLCSQSIFSFKSLDTLYSKTHNILFDLLFFQIAYFFLSFDIYGYENEWTATPTTAAASSIEVRVSDSYLFYFGTFNLFVIILLDFIHIMFYFDYLQSAIRGFVCGEAMNVTITGSCI
jgi:hypothetical protein